MKKKISITIIFGAIFFLLINFIKVNNLILIFSDYVLCPLEEKIIDKKYDFSFSNQNLTSELLLEYLDYDAKNLKTNKNINGLIKKAKKIYISVGLNDLLEYVNIVDNELNFNSSILSEKLAIIEYNINEIIASIEAVKNTDIYFLSWYKFNNQKLDEFIDDFNYDLRNIAEANNVVYIEINKIITIDNYSFSYLEQNKLYKEIFEH